MSFIFPPSHILLWCNCQRGVRVPQTADLNLLTFKANNSSARSLSQDSRQTQRTPLLLQQEIVAFKHTRRTRFIHLQHWHKLQAVASYFQVFTVVQYQCYNTTILQRPPVRISIVRMHNAYDIVTPTSTTVGMCTGTMDCIRPTILFGNYSSYRYWSMELHYTDTFESQ